VAVCRPLQQFCPGLSVGQGYGDPNYDPTKSYAKGGVGILGGPGILLATKALARLNKYTNLANLLPAYCPRGQEAAKKLPSDMSNKTYDYCYPEDPACQPLASGSENISACYQGLPNCPCTAAEPRKENAALASASTPPSQERLYAAGRGVVRGPFEVLVEHVLKDGLVWVGAREERHVRLQLLGVDRAEDLDRVRRLEPSQRAGARDKPGSVLRAHIHTRRPPRRASPTLIRNTGKPGILVCWRM
jgi:hypothetical protein